VTPWSNARVWDAVESHRWYPPSSTRVTAENYEVAVTPGSPGLTWIYGFQARDARDAERLLDEIREKVQSLGGTGARISVTPSTQLPGLEDVLSNLRFEPMESAEVLAYDLRDEAGQERPPSFRSAPGVTVREITTREEYEVVTSLIETVFELPAPSEEVRAGLLESYERLIRETGHSERFLARAGPLATGGAGMTLKGPTALLWGTGVLPEFRGRGVYSALVAARCESAVQRGAEIVYTHARTGSSGPILKRHGFRLVGPIRVYQAQWPQVSPSG
jgi:GNAT superfamily N-acetyltransferase